MVRAKSLSGAPRTDSRVRAAVAVAFFVNGLLFASWAAHIPHVKARLGLGDATLGLALLGAPIGSALAMAASAYLLPRLGSRLMVRICLVGYCVAGPFVGLAGTPIVLFGTLAAWGAFQGALDVSMNTQAIAVESTHRRPIMSGLHGCWSIGSFAGAALGTACVGAGVQLSPQLLVLGIPVLAVAGMRTARMITDPPPDRREPDGGAVRRINSAVLVLGGIACASMLCEGAVADWSAVYLHDSLHTSATVAGLGYAVFSVAMVTIRLLGNRLLARFSTSRLISALAGVATVGFGTGLAIGRPVVVLAGFGCLGLGLATVVPTIFGAAGRVPGMHAGVGVAAVSACGWIGFVLGPPLIGELAGLTTLRTALTVVPVLTAVITVVTARPRALDPDRRATA